MTTNGLAAYCNATHNGVALLRDVHSYTPTQLVKAHPNHFTLTEARRIINCATTLFGDTTFTRKQQKFIHLCEKNKLPWDTIATINTYAKKHTKQTTQWDTRITLAGIKGGKDAIITQAKKLAPKKKPRTTRLSITKGQDNMGTLCLTAPLRMIMDTVNTLPALDKTTGLSLPEHRGQAFIKHLRSGGIGEVKYNPMVIIKLEDHLRILRGDHAGIKLACTDGTIMNPIDYINRTDGMDVFAGLFHPEQGGIELGRLHRFANAKQRRLAAAESPVCAYPGCSVPADRCQPHHIVDWAAGGLTNQDNLVMLCPFHNGRNDPPGRRKHGRMTRIGGIAYHLPPWPRGKPRLNHHPTARLGAMHLVAE